MSHVIEIEAIKEILPHRYPFLLLDRVTDYTLGEWIEGFKNVSSGEPCFMGHFPEDSVFPGVLMTEAMAQLAGLLAVLTIKQATDQYARYFYFTGLDHVRFKRVVIPGDRFEMRMQVVKRRSKIWKFKGVATVDGQLACEGDFMLLSGESKND
jgi:3-hydroxyacyl-[acyl-carrier-protein] dehydratase